MLSYRHGFHAGGPADVLKHAIYAFVLAYALDKPKPLLVLDTHAGAAGYDLDDAMAVKTAEWRRGILSLIGAQPPWPELPRRYLELVQAMNPDRRLRWYPGSPALAAALLRPLDSLHLCELHPTDHAALADHFAGAGRVTVVREDGLALLRRVLPPRERRGIVLIDPSYEVKADYETVPAALAAAHRRFATGTFILWYPVIDRARTTAFLEALAGTGIRRQYRVELGLQPDGIGRGMTASGLVVVNPPWTLPAAVEAALPWLAERMGAAGPQTAGWLAPE